MQISQHFHEFFTQKNRQFFSENQKFNFSTKNEDFENLTMTKDAKDIKKSWKCKSSFNFQQSKFLFWYSKKSFNPKLVWPSLKNNFKTFHFSLLDWRHQWYILWWLPQYTSMSLWRWRLLLTTTKRPLLYHLQLYYWHFKSIRSHESN